MSHALIPKPYTLALNQQTYKDLKKTKTRPTGLLSKASVISETFEGKVEPSAPKPYSTLLGLGLN